MQARLAKLILPALLAAAIPTIVLAQQAQAPAQPPADARDQRVRPRLSPEAQTRLQDGRMAMIKETLKLNEAQLKLWAPVEANIRASATTRQQARADRRAARQQQGAQAPRASLPDRLDRATEAMTKRAEQMKAFADVFKPFYAALSDEQKALAGIVMREARGGERGHHRRWAGRGEPGGQQR